MAKKTGRIARRNFHVVTYDEDGIPQVDHYYAGEEIPDDVAAQIDNESIFEGEERHSPGNPEERAAARDADDEANPVAPPAHAAGERRAAAASNNPARLRDADDDEIAETGHADGGAPVQGARRKNNDGFRREKDGFNSMTVQELIQFLRDNDIEIPASGRKADLVAAAEGAGLEAPSDDEQ